MNKILYLQHQILPSIHVEFTMICTDYLLIILTFYYLVHKGDAKQRDSFAPCWKKSMITLYHLHSNDGNCCFIHNNQPLPNGHYLFNNIPIRIMNQTHNPYNNQPSRDFMMPTIILRCGRSKCYDQQQTLLA